MRIARLQTPTGPTHAVERNGNWDHIQDLFAEPLTFTGDSTPSEEAILLAPVNPAVVVGIGHNLGNNDHVLPIQAWHKSVHTIAAPGADIEATRDVGTVNIEGELAAVIGKSASKLTADNALDHVLGYTVVNDVTNVEQNQVDENCSRESPAPTTRHLGRGSKPASRIRKTSAPRWQSTGKSRPALAPSTCPLP